MTTSVSIQRPSLCLFGSLDILKDDESQTIVHETDGIAVDEAVQLTKDDSEANEEEPMQDVSVEDVAATSAMRDEESDAAHILPATEETEAGYAAILFPPEDLCVTNAAQVVAPSVRGRESCAAADSCAAAGVRLAGGHGRAVPRRGQAGLVGAGAL